MRVYWVIVKCRLCTCYTFLWFYYDLINLPPKKVTCNFFLEIWNLLRLYYFLKQKSGELVCFVVPISSKKYLRIDLNSKFWCPLLLWSGPILFQYFVFTFSYLLFPPINEYCIFGDEILLVSKKNKCLFFRNFKNNIVHWFDHHTHSQDLNFFL